MCSQIRRFVCDWCLVGCFFAASRSVVLRCSHPVQRPKGATSKVSLIFSLFFWCSPRSFSFVPRFFLHFFVFFPHDCSVVIQFSTRPERETLWLLFVLSSALFFTRFVLRVLVFCRFCLILCLSAFVSFFPFRVSDFPVYSCHEPRLFVCRVVLTKRTFVSTMVRLVCCFPLPFVLFFSGLGMATCIVVPSDAALVRITLDDMPDAMWPVDLEQEGAALLGTTHIVVL